MTDKSKKNIKKWFAVFLSVWTVLVGVAFIVQVWRIFSFGEKAFTTERIGEYFRQIAVPVYIWLGAVVVGGVLWLAMPTPKQKITPYIDLKCTLARLNKRLNESGDEAKKCQRNRVVAGWICFGVSVVCSVFALVYMTADYQLLAKSGFFAEHKEAERILRALVWGISALALSIATAYFVQASYRKEIALAKETLAQNAKQGIKAQPKEEKPTVRSAIAKAFSFTSGKGFTLGVRIAIGVVAVGFVLIGVFGGGVEAILYKAINICTQCIGIG